MIRYYHIVHTEPNLLPDGFHWKGGLRGDPLDFIYYGETDAKRLEGVEPRYDKWLLSAQPEALHKGVVPVLIVSKFLEDEQDDGGRFGYCHDDYRVAQTIRRTIIVLNARTFRWFGPLKKQLAGWVLKHELGHAIGLEHHFNPFCVMMPGFNVSFGRFCRRCKREGNE